MFHKKQDRNNTEEKRNQTLRQLILTFEDINSNVERVLKLLPSKQEPRLNHVFSHLYTSIQDIIVILNKEITDSSIFKD